MLKTYPEILAFMPRPQFNLWPYWAARQQSQDGILNCYIGEGGDEHFGGYWYKKQCSYPEQWAHLFTFVDPAYKTIYAHFSIGLHAPLHPSNLRFNVTYQDLYILGACLCDGCKEYFSYLPAGNPRK